MIATRAPAFAAMTDDTTLNRDDATRVEGPMRGPQFHVDHVFTKRRLSEYLDGDLGPVERDRVERHVDECPDCGRTARSLQRLVAGLALLRRCHPSRLAADVIERLGTQTRRDGDPRRR